MTKEELINRMADTAGISKRQAQAALDRCLVEIKHELIKGDKISLVGFGTFSMVERVAREGRSPQTGKKIKIKATKVVKFKAGSKLKRMVK